MSPAVLRSFARPALTLELGERLLIVRFARSHEALSWGVVGGGRAIVRAVVWHQVDDGDLTPGVDPARLLRRRLGRAGVAGAVGLLTSRRLDRFVDVERHEGGAAARCVATVGLGNALRIGDSPGPIAAAGTINLLCHVPVPLAEGALVETLSLAAEARTAALLDAGVPSRRSGRPATGTGTDCIVVVAPSGRPRVRWAGKHTALGCVVGQAVYDAVAEGVAGWIEERTA